MHQQGGAPPAASQQKIQARRIKIAKPAGFMSSLIIYISGTWHSISD
jgi:hypothetical protein